MEFVPVLDGDLVGAVRVLEERDVSFLERLAVAPDTQGAGVSGWLLDVHESRGYERFTLWESNERTRPCRRREGTPAGFSRPGRRRRAGRPSG